MKNQNKKIALCFFFLLAYNAAFGQKAKGTRVLGWQVDVAENGNFSDSAWPYATCIETAHILVSWNSIEKDKDNWDQTFIQEILGAMNFFYPLAGTKVELQFAPVHISKSVPDDLKNKAYNSPKMIARGKAVLDTLFKYIPKVKLQALSIGNEIDGVFGVNTLEYNAYKEFLDSMVPYAKDIYQNIHGESLKVGVTCTHHGLVNASTSSLCKSLNTNLDYIMTTYYPLENDFTMKDPNVVFSDFETLVNEYQGWSQPIYFAECGYASSTVCNSSEQKQAEFYKEVFRSWDSFSTRIEGVTVFKTTDWSSEEAEGYRIAYNLDNDTFVEYLRTLGVRTWKGNGSNKLAWYQINCELEARNWCPSSSCELSSVRMYKAKSQKVFYNRTFNRIMIKDGSLSQELKLYNVNGVLVSKGNTQINTLAIPKGVYLIEIKNKNEKTYYEKIAIY